uniref:NAD-dependent epimerase/dehydratase family protein n=1 Tax=Horticoccus sp. 23ND18S-11 TaxID=3391832 RepID=UPI0039C8F207
MASMEALSGKRLVIFGCGYVGCAVADAASAADVHVTALTRNPDTAARLRETGVHVVVADLACDRWHDAVAGGPDFVLNCVSSGGGGTDAYRHSYLQGMESILAWARVRPPIGTLLYTSSTSVYPQGDGARVDEQSPAIAASDRAQLLLETEARVRSPDGGWGRWFILRLAGIYGPGRHYLIDQVRAGAVAGAAEHHLNVIHRDDIVSATLACFAAPATVASDVFNVADTAAAPKSEVVAWLAGRLHVPVPPFTGAQAAGRRMVTPDRVIVAGRIASILGWRPAYPTFREGYASLLSH